jgi:parallel beta-helix repeat protein
MQDFWLRDRHSFAIKKAVLAPNGEKGDSKMADNTYLKSALTISVFFVVLAFSATAHAKTIYVDDDGPHDPGPGDPTVSDPLENGTKGHPFDMIQEAIDAAYDGDTIFVNPGTYTGYGNRDIDFLGKTITVRSTDPNNPNTVAATIIDSQGSEGDYHRGFYFRSGEDENSILEGLTITNGFHSTGAGICCHGSSPTIRNNIITGNEIGFDEDGGAGIGCWYGASPIITNNIISDNICAPGGGGGGIRCYDRCSPTITNCTISRNSPQGINIHNGYPTISNCTFEGNLGGGVSSSYFSSPIFINCTFIGNSSQAGGGMRIYESNPTLINCSFIQNVANTHGGGIWIYGSVTASPTLINCTFAGNSAGNYGGGMYNRDSTRPTLVNCTFTGNSAEEDGGAVYNYGYDGSVRITLNNCTFSGNSAANGNDLACDSPYGPPSSVQVTNCIIWDGENPIWNNDGSTITITYSDVHGDWPGEGNIDADPCFVDPDGDDNIFGTEDDDLRLSTGSPCIDAGDPNYISEPNETDLDGKPRVIGGRIDMGAYEFQREPRSLYVDDDAPNDPGTGNPYVSDPMEDGTSAHPFDAIQEAIDATRCGDTVIVLDGTYTGTGNRDIDFNGKPITLRSENGPNHCIIDCQDSGRGFYFNNSEDQNSILDGFTITNGDVSGRNWRDAQGGGIYCGWQNSPTIRNNRIIANKATIGGGVYCSGETVVRNNLITHNTATFSGGGVHCSRHAVIEQNTITDNATAGDGGGVECYEWNTVANNVISRNSADRGGGIWTWEDYPSTIVGNLISENWAERAGGGIGVSWDYYTVIAGNLIVYNATGGSGGAIYLASDSSLIINNTIVGNTATSGGGIVNLYWEARVTNCIVWGNGADLFGCTVTYSCIEDDDQGEGNIHSNPLFVDPLNGDYHLLWGSPCIDTGDPNYIAEPNDRPRVIGGRIDMGPYEYGQLIPAEARIAPRTINLASKGNWITCYIWLPDEYDVADIEPNSIFLEGQIQPEQFSVDEQKQVATARFSREDVQPILDLGDINLKITGLLIDGTWFEATDTIKVIGKADKK